jgi:hypothetical protein
MPTSASPARARLLVTTSLALIALAVTGCASTVLVPIPASHDFGEVYIGQSATSPAVVWRNVGANPENIDGLVPTPLGGPFSLATPAPPFVAFVLPAGATTRPFTFAFRPTVEGGVNGGATPQTVGTPGGSYQEFAMVGIGRSQITRGVLGIGGGNLVPAQALDFGAVRVPGGTPTSRTVTIINAGPAPIAVNVFVSAAGFRVALPALPVTIPARGQVTVTLTFSPPAVGRFDAVVEFFDTAGPTVNRAGTIVTGQGTPGG